MRTLILFLYERNSPCFWVMFLSSQRMLLFLKFRFFLIFCVESLCKGSWFEDIAVLGDLFDTELLATHQSEVVVWETTVILSKLCVRIWINLFLCRSTFRRFIVSSMLEKIQGRVLFFPQLVHYPIRVWPTIAFISLGIFLALAFVWHFFSKFKFHY